MSAISLRFASGAFAIAERTAPGPDTPTFITQSGSPGPWKAPAMNGLSSGALQKTTSFAQPMQSRSFVSFALLTIVCPIRRTASMLIPAFVDPMLIDEQTWSVSASAWGMAPISSRSPAENPFWTRAEKPPMKLTPVSRAAFSSVFANITGSPFAEAASIAIGVTDILLFIIGIPYVFSISSPTGTSLPQRRMILS